MNLLISLIAILILTLSALGIAFSATLSFLLTVDPPLCRLCGLHCRIYLSHRQMGQGPRSLPHHDHLRPADLPSLDQEPTLWRAPPPLGRDRADGPGDLPVPVALPEHRRGDRGETARLRQRQMALVFRASLSLVAADHRASAPAFLHRADRPLDQRPLGYRRILRDRRPDPLSERRRHPCGADVSVSPPDGRPAAALHLPGHRLLRAPAAPGHRDHGPPDEALLPRRSAPGEEPGPGMGHLFAPPSPRGSVRSSTFICASFLR